MQYIVFDSFFLFFGLFSPFSFNGANINKFLLTLQG